MATKVVSVLTGGTNSHETTSEEINALYTDILSDGIVGAITNTSGVAPATGNFAVNAQGTPDMTVAVSQGVAYVTGTPTGGSSQRFRVSMWASENVTIAANSTGGTRYDHIYIKLDPDTLANPNTAGDDVATLVASRSTSASTDNGTPPTYGYKIAVVTVSNGASSIANANITDSRVRTGVNSLSSSVNVPTGTIGGAALSTSAIYAGSATITTSFATTSLAPVQVTGLSTTFTVPAGGRRVRIIVATRTMSNNTAGSYAQGTIWDGTVGSGTKIGTAYSQAGTGPNGDNAIPIFGFATLSAGSHTINVGLNSVISGTASISGSAFEPSTLWVEFV